MKVKEIKSLNKIEFKKQFKLADNGTQLINVETGEVLEHDLIKAYKQDTLRISKPLILKDDEIA